MVNNKDVNQRLDKKESHNRSSKRIMVGALAIGIASLSVASISGIHKANELTKENSRLRSKIFLNEKVSDKLSKDNNNLKDEVRRRNNEIIEKSKQIKDKDVEIEVKSVEIEKLKKTYDNLIKERELRRSQQVVSRGGQAFSTHQGGNIGNWITMNASAYTNSPSENGGYSTTAMGDPLVFGMVAIDPNFIPLGTRIMIEGYGNMIFKCSDTGGAIKGNRIDILLGSKSEAMKFGRRQVRIKIIK